MSLWEDVKSNLMELYSVTSDKTSELARTGSRRWDKFGISRDIERQFSELGNLVYTGLQDGESDILEQDAVKSLVVRIGELEEELRLKTEEIDNLKRDYKRKKDAAATVEETEMESVITDPILDAGSPESAILVEPVEVIEDSGDVTEGDSPEKQG